MDTISLISDDAVAALRAPGTVPDPEAAARYLTATSPIGNQGLLHAVDHTNPDVTVRPGRWSLAVCGDRARVAKPRLTYGDTAWAWPLGHRPCLACLWYTAIATTSAERLVRQLAPDPDDAGRLAEAGCDSLVAVKLARAILATVTPGVPDMTAVARLVRVTEHRPDVTGDLACNEGDCYCADEVAQCPRHLICRGCTMTAGAWAGQYEGMIVAGGHVKPPCSVIQALASHYKVTQATSPYDTPVAARG